MATERKSASTNTEYVFRAPSEIENLAADVCAKQKAYAVAVHAREAATGALDEAKRAETATELALPEAVSAMTTAAKSCP